jgi:hypothetical protein
MNTTAKELAGRYAELTAADSDQRWAAWSDLYAAIADRPDTVSINDIVAASKATDYPMGKSTVTDCVLAAEFTRSPLAASILAERYAGKRPTRVHSMVRAVIVKGKGGTATVRELAATLAGDIAKAGKAKDAEDRERKAVNKALAGLLKAGKVEPGKRKPRPAAESGQTVEPGQSVETVETPKVPLTVAEYLAAMAGNVGKIGELVANGKVTPADLEAIAAHNDRMRDIQALAQSNRTQRRSA